LGTYAEHITQGKSNLVFLTEVNKNNPENWDWQVTVCFYAALHFISAHVVFKTGKNYLSHSSINDAINPTTQLSVAKLDEKTYLAYTKLYQLSRRARYLINENSKHNIGREIQTCNLTHSIHFKRAINHLETVMNFIAENYLITFSKSDIKCIDLNGLDFINFTIKA
jgi:hypothetical protein